MSFQEWIWICEVKHRESEIKSKGYYIDSETRQAVRELHAAKKGKDGGLRT